MSSSAPWPSGSRRRWGGSGGRVHRRPEGRAPASRTRPRAGRWGCPGPGSTSGETATPAPRQRGAEQLAAEIAPAVRRAPRHVRVAADHRRSAGGGVAGQQEHRRGDHARAGPGRPAQEAAPGHDPAGQGSLAGAGPGRARLPAHGGQPQVVRRRHRDRHRRGQAATWTRCWTWAPGGSSGSRSASTTTRSWPTARWSWPSRSAAARCPA